MVTISTGSSRKALSWNIKKIEWPDLVTDLSKTIRTKETSTEFRNLPKSQQDEIKDVGGFVGGSLVNGQRKKGSVRYRDIITLDADHVSGDIWRMITSNMDCALCIYSTHKHTPSAPRIRVVIPLSKKIKPGLYEPISRWIADKIGIEYFDDTTYQAHRLMYWPSTSSDAEFLFKEQKGDVLDPSAILEEYKEKGLDYKDPFHWPHSSRETIKRKREMDKAGDPKTKKGLVGLWCRAYTVDEAIASFLGSEYTEIGENRYTYLKGSTTGGLITYDDGAFCYSHHESDPAGGRLCNSFDLIRLHKFSSLDVDGEKSNIKDQPSYKAMLDYARDDERVKALSITEKTESAAEDFDPLNTEEAAVDWTTKLKYNRNGLIDQTINNARLVLENDENVKGKIAYNEFSRSMVISADLPWHTLINSKGDRWSDEDDAGLRLFLEHAYGIAVQAKIADALTVVAQKNKYHPIRQYLNGLTWDGKQRVETLLVDYLGAQDSIYTRAVTRKTLVAAVARVMQPGIKFDYMLVLYGAQGIGKSYLVEKLANGWYSDSINTVQGKEAYEQLQGAWLIEMAELSATRKAEAEAVKHFISKNEDMFRAAYARHVTRYPRQCIFIGTTNDKEFLRDRTGNRRYWPVTVHTSSTNLNMFRDLTETVRGQIWAEAVDLYKNGESLFLEGKIADLAIKAQVEHLEDDPTVGLIQQFLELGLPDDWGKLSVEARRLYISGTEFGKPDKLGTNKRDKVCAIEILMELMKREKKEIRTSEVRDVNSILRNLDDWEECENGDKGRLKFDIYGRQRAFIRKDF